MKTAAQTTFAERLGRTLGRAWRGCARLDRRAQGWLLAQGWAPGIAKAALLAVKLAAIGVLLYTAFWLALLLAFALVGAWVVRNDDGSYDEEHKPEWRYGPAGYGLYTHDDYRIDPHDPEDEQA
ncbi:TPA: DUF3742 family protein [Pseudomonas aeruginosa]|jgi:hypothetical protein|uniref:DUF3742 family protein n=9 Tax=Pseudomonadota TaxID=1224 RepID=A0A1H3JGC7_9BURK|nr:MULTISPECIES: DUF3742 family protein [Pseudomonadota]AIX73475.1 signal peptide protein [Pantoea sp. PSNIH2]EPL63890.1 hypothetical protein B382_05405 [Stutzerimonas stutzeri B1SMN1]MBA4113573.1 DUF3742 domain-containing protein [Verminephrobacter sp.]MBP6781691.1 DUF3742 family protein [Ottowia sp.]MBS3911395.1 DUF3742 family protein [Hydrogenophaga sp.]MCB1995835.1 DUF3742 family protein [Rhodoferax sp.]MCP5258433.1 DUF3742 family protein [Burkholderiaceae bacterium]POU44638.1 DUF3742 d